MRSSPSSKPDRVFPSSWLYAEEASLRWLAWQYKYTFLGILALITLFWFAPQWIEYRQVRFNSGVYYCTDPAIAYMLDECEAGGCSKKMRRAVLRFADEQQRKCYPKT